MGSSGTSSRRIFFMFILLISNHTVFLVQFGINLYLWVFQKAEIALAEAARAISAFWKTHSCKLIPNWTRNRVVTFTNNKNNNNDNDNNNDNNNDDNDNDNDDDNNNNNL